MSLKPYQQRVVEELRELEAKVHKLACFVHSNPFWDLPDEDQLLLQEQLKAMNEYEHILRLRVQRFGL